MPQPIDPMTELARITAAERIQQIADRASLAAQQRTHNAQLQQTLEADTQVRQTEQKSEHVDSELRRRNPFMGRRRHQDGSESQEESGEAETEKKQPPVAGEEHSFDISV